jgi:hypothetical protein
MLLLSWKYAFSIKPYSSCTSLNVKKNSGATFEKKKERKKVRRERERKGQVSYWARRACLPKRNKFRYD